MAAELSACKVVIFTPLHGTVIIHAYGIPWVWAKVAPALVGDEFKFYDLLEGVRISASPVYISPQEIKEGYLNNLARHARLHDGEDVTKKQRALLSALLSSAALAMLPLLNKRWIEATHS